MWVLLSFSLSDCMALLRLMLLMWDAFERLTPCGSKLLLWSLLAWRTAARNQDTAFNLWAARRVKHVLSLSEACHANPWSQEAHKVCRASGPLSLGSPGSERPTEGFKYFIPTSFLQTYIATGADCLGPKWWSQIVIKFILYFPLLKYQGS